MKKGALRNFTKFTGKHRLQSLFFNKVAGPRPKHLFYRTPLDDCFSHSEDPGALWTLRFRHLSLRYVDSQTLGHSGTWALEALYILDSKETEKSLMTENFT